MDFSAVEMEDDFIFQLKQKFLRTIPHPKVLQKYRNQLSEEFKHKNINYSPSKLPLEEFLSQFILKEAQIKLGIANAQTEEVLAKNINDLLSMLSQLIGSLAAFDFNENISTTIKVSEPIPAYEILKFIRENKLNQVTINSYLINQDYSQEKANFDVLIINIIKAKLIVENG